MYNARNTITICYFRPHNYRSITPRMAVSNIAFKSFVNDIEGAKEFARTHKVKSIFNGCGEHVEL